MSAFDPKRTFVKIELRLGYPKCFFEGALEWMFMPTSERDDVSSLFLRQFVRIVTALRGSLVMDEKHLLRSRVRSMSKKASSWTTNSIGVCSSFSNDTL